MYIVYKLGKMPFDDIYLPVESYSKQVISERK